VALFRLSILSIFRLALTRKAAKVIPQEVPPSVVAYHQLTRLYPPAFLWEEMDRTIGCNGGVERWVEIVKAYISHGWNKANVANMLDFYRRGELPGAPRGSPSAELADFSPQAEAFLRLSRELAKQEP
jgi:hypothetical protein